MSGIYRMLALWQKCKAKYVRDCISESQYSSTELSPRRNPPLDPTTDSLEIQETFYWWRFLTLFEDSLRSNIIFIVTSSNPQALVVRHTPNHCHTRWTYRADLEPQYDSRSAMQSSMIRRARSLVS